MEDNTQEALDVMRHKIKQSKHSLVRWAKGFEAHPAESLDWGAETFRDAARVETYAAVVNALEAGTGATLESIKAYALDRIRTGARSPKQSTSATANLMDQCRLMAWAEILEDLG